MANILQWLFGSTYKPSRDSKGFISISSMVGVAPKFNTYGEDLQKFQAVLSNPALLKVFTLQCDLYSLGQIYLKKDGVKVDNDPILNVFKSPNPFQTQSQLLWDYMFFNMLGTSYMYLPSKILSDTAKLYNLIPSQIQFPESLVSYQDKFILSNKSNNEILDKKITYKFADGTSKQIPLNEIIVLSDLSNGTGNWFKGNSRIDALYKVISNSEAALDATNINIRYSGKFLVSGTQDPKDVTKTPLSNEDKLDLETKVNGRKQVHAFKSMLEIKRFVENNRNLELGKQYLEAYYLIGSMYNIPKDVLEAYNSGTFENQEKARGSHVSYTLEPKGINQMQSIAKYFGYDKKGYELCISWEHLPFMQVFEKDKAETRKKNAETLTSLLKLGIPLDECNNFLGTNFTKANYESKATNN